MSDESEGLGWWKAVQIFVVGSKGAPRAGV